MNDEKNNRLIFRGIFTGFLLKVLKVAGWKFYVLVWCWDVGYAVFGKYVEAKKKEKQRIKKQRLYKKTRKQLYNGIMKAANNGDLKTAVKRFLVRRSSP